MSIALIWITAGRARIVAICTALLLLVVPPLIAINTAVDGPLVVGIQLEGATERQRLSALDQALKQHPDADLFAFSEYSFDGPMPTAVIDWCRQNEKYLIAGGKELVDGGPLGTTFDIMGPWSLDASTMPMPT